MIYYCGPGSRQLGLHHQRYQPVGMESFEILYASTVITVDEILQIAAWNKIRLKFLAQCFMLARHWR